ncbi:MAG: hypothetical protein AB1505_36715 [Candidatus Latescibacterota bacterium]
MDFTILSGSASFIAAMLDALRPSRANVYVATSWDEYELLRMEGVLGGVIVDPVYADG